MTLSQSVFKAYDIRGLYPEEIDEAGAYRIGLAYAQKFQPKTVVVGQDVREANGKMKAEIIRALAESGVRVIDIGIIATDMLYFAVFNYGYDGGIAVSASHNPAGYAGMKIVTKNAEPIFQGNGLPAIRDLAASDDLASPGLNGAIEKKEIENDYFNFLLSFITVDKLKPARIVVNPNFGVTGKILERLIKKFNLPLQIVPLNFEPDGNFPKGRPDPMVPENRAEILDLATREKADFGVAWDADGDRCFFCDNQGIFYEPCYITAVLIENLLRKKPGAKIIYDVRYAFAIQDAIARGGGEAIIERVGHSFIKARMRQDDAIFCGESSGHYYFKENSYCDNGLIPFLLLWEALSLSGKTLPELTDEYTSRFFVSGEFNNKVADSAAKIKELAERYSDGKIDYLDGITVEYPDWRFNVRSSNTEPLLRLNLEARDENLMATKRDEVLGIIKE